MQKTIEKNITSTLKEAKNIYSKEIVKALDSDSVDDVLHLIHQLKNVNSALSIFSSQDTEEKSVKNISKENSKETRKTTQKTNNGNSKNTVSLSDNLVNKRPVMVVIDNNKLEVSSFRDVVRVVCSYFFNVNTADFKNLQNNPSVNGDEHQYFSLTQNKENSMDEIVNENGEKMYIDTAKLAVNNMFFLKRMLVALNYDVNDIKIKIDKNYQRKERTKKVKTEETA